jgi:hypothetical protein
VHVSAGVHVDRIHVSMRPTHAREDMMGPRYRHHVRRSLTIAVSGKIILSSGMLNIETNTFKQHDQPCITYLQIAV